MKFELEPVRQKSLKHDRDIALFGDIFGLRGDIVARGIEPGRSTGDLVWLDAPRNHHHLLQRHVGYIDPSARSHADAHPTRVRRSRLDGSDLEFGVSIVLRERADN